MYIQIKANSKKAEIEIEMQYSSIVHDLDDCNVESLLLNVAMAIIAILSHNRLLFALIDVLVLEYKLRVPFDKLAEVLCVHVL